MSVQNSLVLTVEYKINCVSFNTNKSLLSKKFRSHVWISRRLGSCWNFPFYITSVVAPSLQFRNNNNNESESKIIGLETSLTQIEGERQKLECIEEGLFYAFNRTFTSLAQAGAVKARRNAFNNH